MSEKPRPEVVGHIRKPLTPLSSVLVDSHLSLVQPQAHLSHWSLRPEGKGCVGLSHSLRVQSLRSPCRRASSQVVAQAEGGTHG